MSPRQALGALEVVDEEGRLGLGPRGGRRGGRPCPRGPWTRPCRRALEVADDEGRLGLGPRGARRGGQAWPRGGR